MPIYQYKCSECDHRLEALQKMSDPRLTDCPACHKPGLRKQLTAAAFKLKGSGWYETDFKNSGAKPAPAKASAENKSTDADTATSGSGSDITSSGASTDSKSSNSKSSNSKSSENASKSTSPTPLATAAES